MSVVSSPFRPVPIHPHPPLASRVARKKHASSSIPHRTNARVDAIHARDAMAAGRPRRSRLVDGRVPVPTVHAIEVGGSPSNRRVMTHYESLRSRSRPVPSRYPLVPARATRVRATGARDEETVVRRRHIATRDVGSRLGSRSSRVLSRSFVRDARGRSFARSVGRSTSTSVDRFHSFIHSFEADGDGDGARGKRGDVSVVGETVARRADADDRGERGEGGAWARGGGWIAPERADERETTAGGRGGGTEWVRGGTARARGVCGETSERCARAEV